MGNLEKLVVLTVIFLAGVVLAVSMKSGGEGVVYGEGNSPAADLGRRAELTARGPATDVRGAADPLGDRLAGLDATERATSAAADLTPASALASSEPTSPPLLSASAEPEGWQDGVLRPVDGLVPTLSENYQSWTCRADDTYSTLARRFYGSTRYADALRRANPDKLVLTAGTELSVPSDVRPSAVRSVAAAPQPQRGFTAPTTQVVEKDVDGELGTTFREHTVARGETLSHIAEKYYGRAVLWRRIYDENREEIADPDRVSEGTVLRIP
ncbi:MAG: LysM peptidoglycan-binding domain-containing protein [Planctomycetota bacterium]|jgi:nucleoid-associated protein YgaU